jgi:hypothetical protein
MIAITARKNLQMKLEHQARERRQPLKTFSQIFAHPAREWLLPKSDEHAKDSLTPPSGARATMTLLNV